MTWLRRFLAVFLALLFIPLFMGTLFVSRVNGTLGNPDFYIDQLRKADIYNFIYDEFLPAALEEIEPTELPVDITALKAEAVPFAKQALPPDWLQAQVEQAITQLLPYLMGDTEEFAITIPLKERMTATGEALKDVLGKEELVRPLYEKLVSIAGERARANLNELPFPLPVTQEEVEWAIKTLFPQDWLVTQFRRAIDEVIPYLAGDTEHFALRIPLQDRVEAAGEVAVVLLSKPETYERLLKQLEELRGQEVTLFYPVVLSREEVAAVYKELLPYPWFQERVKESVHHVVSYLTGASPSLMVEIPLAEPKAAATKKLEDIIDRKLEEFFAALPECTLAELIELMEKMPLTDLPSCRPAGTYQEVKKMLSIDVGSIS